jgi:hypothetical protein
MLPNNYIKIFSIMINFFKNINYLKNQFIIYDKLNGTFRKI